MLCPWDSPGKNTGVGCCALLQEIFLTWELNLHLPVSPALQTDPLPTEPRGKPQPCIGRWWMCLVHGKHARAPWGLLGEGAVSLWLVRKGVIITHLTSLNISICQVEAHHPCQCLFRHLFFLYYTRDKWERKFDKQFVLCQLHQITAHVCPSNHTKPMRREVPGVHEVTEKHGKDTRRC